MSFRDRIELLASPGSPYSRKMIAYLRYRRLPHAVHWGGHHQPPEGLPTPKNKLLPTIYLPIEDGYEAIVDSTPIIRRLESERDGRSALPEDPALGFLNFLIEDFADEWCTKQMFHFRWAHRRDAAHAGALLAYWTDPTLPTAQAEAAADNFTRRQIDRLYVVGSNAVTAETIEASYQRLLGILDTLIERQGYLFGSRPASADFAHFGQLTQLTQVEPTPGAIAAEQAPRVRGWVDRVEDLSGLDPRPDDWVDRATAGDALGPLLAEIGRVYAPFLLANAEAVRAGREDFEAEIDGRVWQQPSFPYQAKCLAWIREQFVALRDDDRQAVRKTLAGTGCEALLA